MNNAGLLAANTEPEELAYIASGGRSLTLDPPIERVGLAWECPAKFLPWLAWALRVDDWDDAWPEVVKRQAIDDSPYYNSIRGTALSIDMIMERTGYEYQITEWWQTQPLGRRGTATIIVDCPLDQINPVLTKLRPKVQRSKPLTRAVFLGAGQIKTGELVFAAGLLVETLTTVAPYNYAGQDTSGEFVFAAGLLVETLTTVESMI